MLPSPLTVPLQPLLLGGLLLVVTLAGFCARAGRREDGRRFWRRHVGWAGAVILGLAWVSPLQTVAAHYLLSGHLVQITLVMGVAPPLLLLALPSRASMRLPSGIVRGLRWLVHPVTGMIVINAAFFGWHLSGAFEATLRSGDLYAVQQLSLLAASLLFWWPIVMPLGSRRVLSPWATLGYILVATIPQTFAGITVALAHHPLYPSYASAPRLFGLGVMTDQQVAGACIALVSKIALFTAFSVIFMRMLDDRTNDGEDDGGGGGRRPGADTPSPQPSGSVPWLNDLNAGRTVPEPEPRRIPLRQPVGAAPRRV